jgi:hypothetical protein
MRRTISHRVALISALLAFGGGAAHADGLYDRKLERAVKAIVAKKVSGPLRGSLEGEWRPSAHERNVAIVTPIRSEAASQTSILTLNRSASPTSGTTASIEALRTGLAGESSALEGSNVGTGVLPSGG